MNISGNSAKGQGGGVYVNAPNYFEMDRSDVSRNSATVGGGVVLQSTSTGLLSFSIQE